MTKHICELQYKYKRMNFLGLQKNEFSVAFFRLGTKANLSTSCKCSQYIGVNLKFSTDPNRLRLQMKTNSKDQ